MKSHPFIWLLLIFTLTQGFSQTYPVANNVQLLPPYSLYLQDYVNPASDQLRVNLLLKDLNEPFYNVRLHVRIEGTGIVIESLPNISVPPIAIQGGMPATLTASELAPYFDFNNLTFSGISRSEFVSNGRLPEGFYRFCFTVLDYQRTDVSLSNTPCASIWVVQNDPPRTNFPMCGSEIPLTDIQSVIFNWAPMHTSSPNAMNNTEYEFKLYEVRPADRNPNDVVLSSAPIYEERTSFTSLFYGPSEPALIPGQSYVWRVQAVDLFRKDLFKNNGYSEVCTFTFGQGVRLEPPANILATAEAQRRARVEWDLLADATGYEVAYRKNKSNGKWFTSTTADISALINDLEPSTSYEAQVTSLLNNYRSDPSEIVYFTTPDIPDFTCGDQEVEINHDTFVPLEKAMRGSIFSVGQFEMRLLDVEGENGTFSGIGKMYVPYFGTTITCKFTKVTVNEHHEVIQGDVFALTNGMAEILEDWAKLPPEDETEEGDDENLPGQEIIVEGIIDSIAVDSAANTITLIKEDGTTEEFDLIDEGAEDNDNSEGKKFTDEEGSVWVVTPDGEVKKQDEKQNIPGDEMDSLHFIKDALIAEVLQKMNEEALLWIENNEKGPLDEVTMRRLRDLPKCFPDDLEGLQQVLIKLEYYTEHEKELISLIEEDSTRKDRFHWLVRKLNGKQPPYLPGLNDDELEELYLMICPYVVEEEERPELVTIVPITDDQFAAGIDDDKLEITYSIKTTDKYPLKYAKLEVYKNDGMLAYVNSENIEIGEGKVFEWDGKMNQGIDTDKYIRYDDGEFTVKILASTEQRFNDSFEASTTARVDIDADKWRDFDHQDIGVASAYWSFETFKGLKTGYITSLDKLSLKDHPLDYLNESLVPIKFLGQGPFLLNIRFGYVLKLFEQSLTASKKSEYTSYLNKVSFDSKLRMTSLGSGVSNHSLGFALDLNAPENPMIIDPFIYHFIEFVTGIESFYGRRERTNAFIDELKNTHNTFVNRLNLDSSNAVTWESLTESAEKIEVFENRESDSETSPLYFLAEAAGNVPLNDLEAIRISIENLNDADITEEEITEACNDALEGLELVETQITSLQSIVTEYEEGMLREYFVPEELTALKEYLRVATEQIENNRINLIELKEYIALNNVEQLFQDFLNYLNVLLEKNEEQGSFNKTSELNDLNDHVIAVYNGFKSLDRSLDTYKKYLENIKGKVNQASSATGKDLMEKGFFNLRSDFIKDWFAIDYSYWGGFYDDNHDFMHLEVVNSYKQKALDRLHQQGLEFYKNFFEENYPEEYNEMFNE